MQAARSIEKTSAEARHRSRFASFTLIELLVVISIIAVLAAMLLPALSRARQHTKTVVCLSNLKQLHLYTSIYGSESDEFPPPWSTQQYNTGLWNSFWFNVVYREVIDASGPIWATSLQTQSGGFGWTPNDGSIFLCPAQEDPSVDLTYSYGANGSFRAYENPLKRLDGTGWGSSTHGTWKKLSRIHSDTLLYADIRRQFNPGFYDVNLTSPSTPIEPEGPELSSPAIGFNWQRHGAKRCNFLFFDGSAATYRWGSIFENVLTYKKD